MFKKAITFCLIIVLFIGLFIIPANAAEYEPAMQVDDVLQGALFNIYADGKVYMESYRASVWWPPKGNSYEIKWNHYTSMAYDYLVFTIYVNRKPDRVFLDKVIEDYDCELVGSVDGHYYTYKTSGDVLGHQFGVVVEYDKTYTGPLNLVSCHGYYDVAKEISTVDFECRSFWLTAESTQYLTTVDRSGVSLPQFARDESTSATNPISYGEAFVTVQPDYRDMNFAKSISFVIEAVGSAVDVTAALVDSSNTMINPLSSISYNAISHTSRIKGDYQWFVTSYLVTVDLSGYDLTDKAIQLIFSAESVYSGVNGADNEFYELGVVSCYMTADVKPNDGWWGSVMFWFATLKTTIKNEVRAVVDALKSAAGGIGSQMQGVIDNEKQNTSSAGHDAIGEMTDVLPDESAGFMVAVQSLASSMSYDGIDAKFEIPAIDFPDLPGTMDGFRLLDEQSVDLGWWVQQLPDSILSLVQILGTIALIVYCFKELYSLVAYAMTLKGELSSE